MNPPLEVSWRHAWRQDLQTGATNWLRRSFRGAHVRARTTLLVNPGHISI
ncbi:hypothetical protein [Halorhodospira halochloris]|nr:hypothetical protein [Halorhodospira halochloris]